MPDNLVGPLAQTPLRSGMQIVLEALHPDTGAAVGGVIISDVVISGIPEEAEGVPDSGSNLGPLWYVPGSE